MIRRAIQERLEQTIAARRVTVVSGPRQAGKTTLVRGFIDQIDQGTFRSFDDEGVLQAAKADPIGFANAGERPLVVDEVQLGGDSLVRAVKAQVDQDSKPGQFVLTGSSNFLTIPTISESLAGRAGFVEVWPFTQGEIAGQPERFIDILLANPEALSNHSPSGLTKAELLERIVTGGYPEVQRLEGRQRSDWFRDYVRSTIERDIVQIFGIRKVNELGDLLRIFAARTGCELVMNNVVQDSDLERQAVYDYRSWLQTVHLVMSVPAWSRNLTRRAKQRPKVYITDPGLAAALLGKSSVALLDPIDPATGQLVETFVATEIRRQLTWSNHEMNLMHFQDRRGGEIDLVLEALDGRVIAIEVKAGETPRTDWFKWLHGIRDQLGDSFVTGIALYAGDQVLPFGDRLWAAPISTLWELQ